MFFLTLCVLCIGSTQPVDNENCPQQQPKGKPNCEPCCKVSTGSQMGQTTDEISIWLRLCCMC